MYRLLDEPPGIFSLRQFFQVHTLKAFLEAEAYDGPALIIAYSHCIAHGINMTTAMQNQKAAVNSGQWLLYRYNPERATRGENPLQLDS